MAITRQAVSRLVWVALLLAPGRLLHPPKELSPSAPHLCGAWRQWVGDRGCMHVSLRSSGKLTSSEISFCVSTRRRVSALKRFPLALLLFRTRTKEAATQCDCGRELGERLKHTTRWTRGAPVLLLPSHRVTWASAKRWATKPMYGQFPSFICSARLRWCKIDVNSIEMMGVLWIICAVLVY